MSTRLSDDQKKAADITLGRLDRAASAVQANYEAWGLSFDDAAGIVHHLDRVADDLEAKAFGPGSMVARQVEIIKKNVQAELHQCRTAKVLHQDADEPYMKSFAVSQGVVQADGDEPYMSAYADDQSSAVQTGKSTTGRPLAP